MVEPAKTIMPCRVEGLLSFCCYTVILLSAAFVLPMPVLAQEQSPTTVQELVRLGIEKNIGLQIEKINLPLTAAEVIREDAAFDAEFYANTNYSENTNPLSLASFLSPYDSLEEERLAAGMGLRKNFHSGGTANLSLSSERVSDNNTIDGLDPRYRTALLLDLTQPLLRDFGETINTTNRQLASQQREQAGLGYLFQAQLIALQIELNSRQLAGEAKIVELQQDAVRLATELLDANRRRFDAGVIPVSEVQETETALADRELNRSLAVQRQRQSHEDLNRLLDHALPGNYDASRLFQEPENPLVLNLPDEEALFSAAREIRPDLQSGQVQIASAELQKIYAENQLKPQLDLKLQAGLNGLAGEERAGATSGYAGNWSDSFLSTAERDGYQWSAGVEFSLPLGNRAAKSRYLQSGLQQKQASYRLRDRESALKGELKQQRSNLERSIEQVALADRFTSLAEKSLRQEQRRLEEGLSDTFRIISFQDKMIAAQVSRINALVKYQQTLAQLNFSRGIILQQHGIEVKLETAD